MVIDTISLAPSNLFPSCIQPLPNTDTAEPQEIDLIYQVLKQAGEISSSRSGSGAGGRALTPAPTPGATSNNHHSAPAMDGNSMMIKSSSSATVKQSEQANGSGSTAASSAASSVGSLHRRSGPTQQPPLLLRGAASSLTVGPVPHASSSGVFAPTIVCVWCCSLVYVFNCLNVVANFPFVHSCVYKVLSENKCVQIH